MYVQRLYFSNTISKTKISPGHFIVLDLRLFIGTINMSKNKRFRRRNVSQRLKVVFRQWRSHLADALPNHGRHHAVKISDDVFAAIQRPAYNASARESVCVEIESSRV